MRNILIVVDMQNDFIDGALGTAEAVSIVPNVKAKMAEYDIRDIYATMDTHEDDYLTTQEGRNLPVPHCIRGTKGWELSAELSSGILSDHIIEKPGFGSPELARLMQSLAKEEDLCIELVGLCTDICVVSNALLLKAALRETPLSVDASCCAGVTPEAHRAALTTMKSCQIRVTDESK